MLSHGEILILRNNSFFVHKSMQRVQTGDKDVKTKIIIQTPKSDCSIRKIPIPDEMLQLLIQFKKTRRCLSIDWDDSQLHGAKKYGKSI